MFVFCEEHQIDMFLYSCDWGTEDILNLAEDEAGVRREAAEVTLGALLGRIAMDAPPTLSAPFVNAITSIMFDFVARNQDKNLVHAVLDQFGLIKSFYSQDDDKSAS